MSRIQRFDRGDLIPAHKTDEGFLFIDGRATRAGVFLYRDDDGNIRRELRPPEEVGDAQSLSTLARKPITLLHPEQFVDAENAQEHAAGVTDPDVEWETYADGFVRVRGTVQRADAVRAIEDGMRELSAGYTAELEMSSGVWMDADGVEHRYDAIQRNIRYNHLAIVPQGRAGRDVRLRLDGAAIQISRDDMKQAQMDMLKAAMKKKMEGDGVSREKLVADMARAAGCEASAMSDMLSGKADMSQQHFEACSKHLEMKKHNDSDPDSGGAPPQKGYPMPTIKIDGHEYSVEETPAVQRAIVAVETSRADALQELETVKADSASMLEEVIELRQAKAELDVLKADQAKRGDAGEPDTDQERIDFANERFELIETARTLKLDGFEDVAAVGQTNAEIKSAIVLSRFDADEVPTEAHVDAAFSLMKKEIAKARQNAPSPNDVLARNLLRADTTQPADVLGNAQKAYMDRVRAHNTKSTN